MRWYRSSKIIIGFVSATLLAMLVGLDFPVSAGIITILNLQDTKKSSVDVSLRRLVSAFFGLILLYILFELMGYYVYTLFVFIAVFTPLAYKFKAKEGLVVNIVLGSHLLIYSEVTLAHFFNEFGIVIIGVLLGLLMSFHVPEKVKKIKATIVEIDDLMKENIDALGLCIRNLCHIDEDEFHIEMTIQKIKQGRQLANQQIDNYYSKDYSYYYEYFQLRLNQAHRVRYMKERLNQVFINQEQAKLLSDFTEKLATVFNPNNDGQLLMKELEEVRTKFSDLPLPETREAFIEQSALYQYLNDIEELVMMKIRYVERNKSQLL